MSFQNTPFIQRIFPFLIWWPQVNRKSLWADFMAGLTGAVIVLPQGVAFAMIAGLPPEYGLYTAMITPVIAALFGSSRHLISGPTTAISIVVFATISQFAQPGSQNFIELALVLALMAGAFQLLLGIGRMGNLVNFVSHTVVIGFTAGAALLIITSQMKHVLGISIARGESFIHSWEAIFTQIGQINPYVLTISLATLFIAIVIRRFLPKWPYLLLAMVLGSVLNWLLHWEALGVSLVGEIPGHLPPFSIPNLSADNIRLLASDAFAIALLGLIEAVSIARSIASHTEQEIDGNQEFIGQGLSNIIGSFFSCYPGSGSFTRSGVNHQAGAKTPIAAIFAAVILAAILLFIAPLTAYLPIPAMGGIILLVGFNLIDFKHIRSIIQASKRETTVLLVTFIATLFMELEFAIYLGVLFSLVFYLQKTSKPRIVRMAPNPAGKKRQFVNIDRVPVDECPQLNVIRIDGSLFFGAVNHVNSEFNRIREENPDQKYLLLLASGINFLDLEGVEWLVQEANRWRAAGGDFYLCGLKRPGRRLLRRTNLWQEVGEDHMFWSKQDAIKEIVPKLNADKCAGCPVRIFQECRVGNENKNGLRKMDEKSLSTLEDSAGVP